jgi:glycosyltransferase involved in cell wall biosynthesis
MKKVGIIVQRYGVKVNGGAEVHARILAEQLCKKYDVTVLTSQALEYQTWDPYYDVGESFENGIKVIRFKNNSRGTKKQQEYYGRKVRGRHLVQKLHRLFGKPGWYEKVFPEAAITEQDHVKWLQYQGPHIPDLLTYLKEKENNYDAYIFFTALYYPTAMGVLVAPHKSIIVPTMHDEKASYMPGYQQVMSAPAWIMFNTEAEKEFSENLFSIQKSKKRVVGVGIDLLKESLKPAPGKIANIHLPFPYIIYIGRVDKNKGCDILIEYFERFRKETKLKVDLVMVGKKMLAAKPTKHVHYTGFVDDETKNQLLVNSIALVIPSFYESLSLVLLESFGAGKPVIANGNTEVLKSHIDKSGGGWNFYKYPEFKKAMIELLTDDAGRIEKGNKGYEYVSKNYSWEKVMSVFDEAIEDVSNRSANN